MLHKASIETPIGDSSSYFPFLPQKNQGLFALYSIAAVLYRWLIVFGILFFLYNLIEHFKQIKEKLLRGILLVWMWCFVCSKHYFPAQLSVIFASTRMGTFFK